MKTINSRHLLPLAAIALIAAACDPFPAAPGGDPRVVRVISTDQNWTGHVKTVENTGSSAGNVIVTGAYPGDSIFIQFNKPMKGSTLQKYSNVETIPLDLTSVGVRSHPADPGEPNAKPPLEPIPAVVDPGQSYPSCLKPDNLTLTGFVETPAVPGVWDFTTHDFEPGTGVYAGYTSVCYYPQSVTDGAQLVIIPAQGMVVGTTYRVQGTVQDYEGKSLTLDVSVTVSDRPVASIGDTLQNPGLGRAYYYGAFLNWFPRPGVATATYQAQAALDDGGGVPPAVDSAAWTVQPTKTGAAISCKEAVEPDGVTGLGYLACQTSWGELDPNHLIDPTLPPDNDNLVLPIQTYWFRISSDGGITWTLTASSKNIRTPITPVLVNFSDPLVGPALIPGAVQIPWARYLGTKVPNATAGAFPPPGVAVPPQPADMPDYDYPFAGPTLSSDLTVIVERIVSAYDTDGTTPLEPADNAAGWTDITGTMDTIDDVVTNQAYNDLFNPYGVTIDPPFAMLFRVGVDRTATSGTGYWYRVRPNYLSGKVILGVPKFKKAL